jgi:hypothetical protein
MGAAIDAQSLTVAWELCTASPVMVIAADAELTAVVIAVQRLDATRQLLAANPARATAANALCMEVQTAVRCNAAHLSTE